MSSGAAVATIRQPAKADLHDLLDAVEELILVADGQLRLMVVSPSVERALGKTCAQLHGNTVASSGIFGS